MKTLTMPELITALNDLFPEREECIQGTCTALLDSQHVLYIGPPGTAKSLMARTIVSCLNKTYFETLMHAFSTPEEVFGPIALSGLQKDKFIRATAGYAPEAEIAFLDEVFKSNAGQLNALLTLLNERIFHNDGKPQAVPLISCIGASNELQEGPQLDALFDRFMVRIVVDYITERDAFKRMLTANAPILPGVCDLATEQAATKAVSLTTDTVDAVTALRYACIAGGFQTSDRRWRNSLGLIKATAHLAGRTATEPDDLECLEHVLWKKPDEKVAISKLVQATISPEGARAVTELDNAKDLVKRIPPREGTDPGAYLNAVAGSNKDLSDILKRLTAMPKSRKVVTALKEVQILKDQTAKLAMRAAGIEM